MLGGVLLLIDNDVPVHEDVVKEEELSRFGFLSAGFGEDTLSDQDPTLKMSGGYQRYQWTGLTRDGQRLTSRPEALFHVRDPPGVGCRVDCNTIQI